MEENNYYIVELCALLDIEYYDLDEDDKEAIDDLFTEMWHEGYEQAIADMDVAPEDKYPEEFGK